METPNIENLLFEKLESMKDSKSILDSIYYDDDIQINNYIENLTEEQSIEVLKNACLFAFKKGCFNLIESELISKSVRNLSK
jgi:hypothetical protein